MNPMLWHENLRSSRLVAVLFSFLVKGFCAGIRLCFLLLTVFLSFYFFSSRLSFWYECQGFVNMGLQVHRVLLVAWDTFLLILVFLWVISFEIIAPISVYDLSQPCMGMVTARSSCTPHFATIKIVCGCLSGEMVALRLKWCMDLSLRYSWCWHYFQAMSKKGGLG